MKKKKKKATIDYISTFASADCGTSRFSEILGDTPLRAVAMIEKEELRRGVAKLHNPETLFFDNILDVKPSEVPPHHIHIMSPPCQGFSNQGLRDPEDPRSKLFFSTLKIIKKHRPKIVIFENVPGLISMNSGELIIQILKALSKAGYYVDFDLINAKYFDTPQSRIRLFIVGVRRDMAQSNPQVNNVIKNFKREVSCARKVKKESHRSTQNEDNAGRKRSTTSPSAPSTTVYDLYLKSRRLYGARCGGEVFLSQRESRSEIFHKEKTNKNETLEIQFQNNQLKANLVAYSKSHRDKHIDHRMRCDGFANTLTTGIGCYGQSTMNFIVEKDSRVRRPTPLECERLMGLSDFYTEFAQMGDEKVPLTDEQRYSILGDGIAPKVTKEITSHLISIFREEILDE